MTVQYRNRVGKIYYLREGKTKTGKPRYFFSSQEKGKGKASKKMPEGYEIYEHPENAQVFLRKKQPRLITEIEEQFIKNNLSSLKCSKKYLIDCKDKNITIYESNIDHTNLKDIFGGLLNNIPTRPGVSANDAMTALVNIADQHYTAILRFRLDNEDKRKFIAERFCFRGSIDDWIYLSGPESFKDIVKKHLRNLGKDEFFDTPFF